MTADWTDRTLCPDGACTGVIGSDGVCGVCGHVAPFWGDERRRGMVAAETEPPSDRGQGDLDDDRELCPDGACVGVIGADGTCGACGQRGQRGATPVTRVVPPGPAVTAARSAAGDDDDRRLCPDGDCVGLLDAAGVCKACGKSDVGN
ncbi:MAG: hypothetical protein IPL61_10805 [Myxococcales bacterium]|nr:hypothetical protein [Myxococcales bacterium]